MSDRLPTFDSAIRFIEAEIAAIDQRRAKLVAALEGLRFVADGPQSGTSLPTPPRPQMPVPQATNGAGLDDKVIALLKNGPLAPMHIRFKTGIKEGTLQPILARLITARKIEKLGTGPRNTRYRLTTNS